MKFLVFISAAPLATLAAPTASTFNKDIAPILYRNCAGCHHTGEVARFPLLSYQDAAKRAKLLAAVTASRDMPPVFEASVVSIISRRWRSRRSARRELVRAPQLSN
jgi:hypothetical protein